MDRDRYARNRRCAHRRAGPDAVVLLRRPLPHAHHHRGRSTMTRPWTAAGARSAPAGCHRGCRRRRTPAWSPPPATSPATRWSSCPAASSGPRASARSGRPPARPHRRCRRGSGGVLRRLRGVRGSGRRAGRRRRPGLAGARRGVDRRPRALVAGLAGTADHRGAVPLAASHPHCHPGRGDRPGRAPTGDSFAARGYAAPRRAATRHRSSRCEGCSRIWRARPPRCSSQGRWCSWWPIGPAAAGPSRWPPTFCVRPGRVRAAPRRPTAAVGLTRRARRRWLVAVVAAPGSGAQHRVEEDA